MPKILRNFIKHGSLSLMSLVFFGLIIIGSLYIYVGISLPDVRQLRDMHLQVPLQVYTSDGKLIAKFGEKNRVPISLDQVPKQLIQAVLATEDQRFYEHSGVDFIGLVRAADAVIRTGKKVQGASTITMQVARNYFLSPDKTYRRKINEILLAFKIDNNFSKKEVLELYLNKIYLGQRAYGVAAAAQVYYGKTLQQLTLPEIAMIAGLARAPSRENPITNPIAAEERRNHVLERMLECENIDEKTYERAITAPITAEYHGIRSEINAPYLAEMVRNAMVAEFGDAAYEGGYKAYTSIDSHLQQIANTALRNGLLAYEKRHNNYMGAEQHLKVGNLNSKATWEKQLQNIPTIGGLLPAVVISTTKPTITTLLKNGEIIHIQQSSFAWAKSASNILKIGDVIRIYKTKENQWQLTQLPKIQGAIVTLDTKNGAILALDGGFSYAQSRYNRAIQADRQTGSSFKPFIYSAAFEKGYTLASIINDAPVVIYIPINREIWRPQNDSKKFYGPTRLRTGLIRSRNLVSVRLLQAIGVPYAVNYIKRFGFNSEEIPATPALALGTATISPLKLAAGYATFANGGYEITPFFINSIVDNKGNTIFKARPAVVPNSNYVGYVAPRSITAQNAYLITSALKDVIEQGTGKRARVLERTDLAGKTGTTNDQMDAWFSGFNNDIITTVWVGYDQPKSIDEHGSQAALPIWIEFMGKALAGKKEHSLPQPEGITTARIDPRTGLLAYPGQKNAIFEVFTNTTVPKKEAYEPVNSYYHETNSASHHNSDNVANPLF